MAADHALLAAFNKLGLISSEVRVRCNRIHCSGSEGMNICYFDTLVVAWSLADLAGLTQPGVEEVKTAMGFRLMAAER